MDVQHIDNNNKNQLVTSLIPPHFIKAKADSGASNHYWRPQDLDSLSNIKSTTTSPKVKLPNNGIIQANKTGIMQSISNRKIKYYQALEISRMDFGIYTFPPLQMLRRIKEQ